MEALWKSQVSGAVLSKGYVRLRVTGALKDGMRRVAEGQRGNYQDARAFVDVDDQWGLGDERAVDPVSLVDERHALESPGRGALPPAGDARRGEDPGRAGPGLHREASGHRAGHHAAPDEALEREVPSGHGRPARRAEEGGQRLPRPGARGSPELHPAGSHDRGFQDRGAPVDGPRAPAAEGHHRGPRRATAGAPSRRRPGLVERAFARSEGSVPVAAKLLGVSVMTARRWYRQLPQSPVDRRVRADLSTATMLELKAQGRSSHEIGKRLGCTSSAVRRRLRGSNRTSAGA